MSECTAEVSQAPEGIVTNYEVVDEPMVQIKETTTVAITLNDIVLSVEGNTPSQARPET